VEVVKQLTLLTRDVLILLVLNFVLPLQLGVLFHSVGDEQLHLRKIVFYFLVFQGLLLKNFDLDQRCLMRLADLLVLFLFLPEFFLFCIVFNFSQCEVVLKLANQIQVGVGNL